MITDYVIFGFLLFFLYKGWCRGIFRTLLKPISFFVGCLIAFFYYQQTHNVGQSFLICILSPFVFRILTSILLNIFQRTTKKEIPLSISSKLFGSIFNVLWSGIYLILFLLLIGFIPTSLSWFEKIQNDVVASKSYNILHQFIGDKVPATSSHMEKLTILMEDPYQLQQFQSTKEFETLMEDAYLKEIFSNEDTAKQIRNKDYSKLMANPKIQSVFENEQLLKKMFALNKKIMESSLEGGFSNISTESQPRVIDIK